MDSQEPEHHARPEDPCLPIAEAESAGHARDRGGRTPPRSPPRPKARGELPGGNARKRPSPGGRRLALGLTAGAAGLAPGLPALSTGGAGWGPVTFGGIGGVLTVGLLIDLVRQR